MEIKNFFEQLRDFLGLAAEHKLQTEQRICQNCDYAYAEKSGIRVHVEECFDRLSSMKGKRQRKLAWRQMDNPKICPVCNRELVLEVRRSDGGICPKCNHQQIYNTAIL